MKIYILNFILFIFSKNHLLSSNERIINEIPLGKLPHNIETEKRINNTKFINQNDIKIVKNQYIKSILILRKTGLTNLLNNTLDSLIEEVNSTVDGVVDVIDTITGEDETEEYTEDNNENENNDNNDNNNDNNDNNDNNNDNNDNNDNDNNDNNKGNKGLIKTLIEISEDTISIVGKFLSDNANQAFNTVIDNLGKYYIPNKVVKMITDKYSLVVYDTSNPPNKTSTESYISFSKCEKELKDYYHIPQNESLEIVKIDSETSEDFPTKNVTYKVYDQRGNQLDTKICSKVTIEIPIKNDTNVNVSKIVIMQNNGIDLTDKTDSFFNDICTPYDADDSSGMPFNQRTTLYVNSTFCDNDCDLQSIESENGVFEAVCNCGKIYAEEASKKKNKNFVKSVLNSNIFVVRCYKLVFNGKRLKKNLGHWLYTIFISAQFIILGFFLFIRLKPLYIYLNSLQTPSNPIERKLNLNFKSNNENNLKTINEINKNNQITYDQSSGKEINSLNEKIPIKIKVEKFYNLPSSDNLILNEHNINTTDECFPKEKEKNEKITEKENITEKHPIDEELINPTEDQIESFPYDKAVKYDKRNFGKTYVYSIFHKQSILNACFIYTNSKLTTVKFATIFIVFSLNSGWNCFFFSQSMQLRRYKGDTSIWIRIPKVILACFSTIVCCFFINLISDYSKNLKNLIEKGNFNKEKIDNFIKIVKCKLISFFSLVWFFSLFFWYFCSAYCAVYPKFGKAWLIDSLQSMFLTQTSPFVFSLLYVCLRVIGIKCHLKVFYTIGKFLDYILDSRYKKFLKLC